MTEFISLWKKETQKGVITGNHLRMGGSYECWRANGLQTSRLCLSSNAWQLNLSVC